MSSSIQLRVYTDQASPADALFRALVDAVAAWGETDGSWEQVAYAADFPAPREQDHEGRLTNQALQDQVSHWARAQYGSFSAAARYRCWTFPGNVAEAGSGGLGIRAWSGDALVLTSGVPWIEGIASLHLGSSVPYHAELDARIKGGRIDDSLPRNQKVRENVESLLELVFQMIRALRPVSIKVFVDSGHFLPFNSHLTYYRDAAAVLDDVRHLGELWESGLPQYDIPPLVRFDPRRHLWSLSELRDASQRHAAWRRLTELQPFLDRVTSEHVETVFRSPEVDSYELDGGRLILNDPYPFDAFLDPFYVQVLERARGPAA